MPPSPGLVVVDDSVRFVNSRRLEGGASESELGVLSGQCLDRRIPDKNTLTVEVAAWQDERNATRTKADWRSSTDDARIKLKRTWPADKLSQNQ